MNVTSAVALAGGSSTKIIVGTAAREELADAGRCRRDVY